MMNMVCNTCNLEKDIDEFPIVMGCKGGRRPKCKSCVKEYHRARNLRLNPIEQRPREIAKRLLQEGLKKCLTCQEIKPLTEYWQNSRWGGFHKNCKDCNRDKFGITKLAGRRNYVRAEYDKAYRNQPEVKARSTANRRARYSNSPRNVMQITLRHGLRRRPTDNPATIDDLMAMFSAQEGCCAITGIKLTWAQGSVLPTSISLDRIDPNGGYSADNLRLICHAVNAFKGRMSDAEMFQMAVAIVTRMDPPKLRLVS